MIKFISSMLYSFYWINLQAMIRILWKFVFKIISKSHRIYSYMIPISRDLIWISKYNETGMYIVPSILKNFPPFILKNFPFFPPFFSPFIPFSFYLSFLSLFLPFSSLFLLSFPLFFFSQPYNLKTFPNDLKKFPPPRAWE